MKISRNPAIAYQQGFKEGCERHDSNSTLMGMHFVYQLLLTAMYNANEYLTNPKLAEFYKRTSTELEKMVNDYIDGEKGLSRQDEIDLLCAHDKEIRKRLKLEELKYWEEGK